MSTKKPKPLLEMLNPLISIIGYAANNDVDLIVIGTRGRTGLKRFLMGGVANGVEQHAHCPVLLVI
jgi:nucleotide-binding universal stress UspA family protein